MQKVGKKSIKKLKWSDIKYFSTIHFLTKTTQKCTNVVHVDLVLHFYNYFNHLSDLYIKMIELYNYER